MANRRSVLGLAAVAAVAPFMGATAASASGARRRQYTVFVAGDSTASTYPVPIAPRAGWGQALPALLDPHRVDVANLALSGASSKSFVEAGLLDAILAAIGPGDKLLISFGHNDSKTDDRHTDPYTTYQEYLTRYIDGARAHGAHPVLVTSVERRRFDANGAPYLSHGEYPAAMKDLGTKLEVPVIDLQALSFELWGTLGVEGTKDYFLWLDPGEHPNYPDGAADNTHFQAHGAIEVARLVLRAAVGQRLIGHRDVPNLCRPVPDDALVWPETI